MAHMKFAASISEAEDTSRAVDELADRIGAQMAGQIDWATLFFTARHQENIGPAVARLVGRLSPGCLLGCSADGVLGDGREIEGRPAMAMLVGRMTGVRFHRFHIPMDHWHDLLTNPAELPERVGFTPECRSVIGLGDPFSFPAVQFFDALHTACPLVPLIGGMASSGRKPKQNVLLLDDEIYDEGFAGVTLSGPLDVQAVVSQGCRPIGRHLIVTKARDNVIEQLSGRNPLAVLREMVNEIPKSDQALLSNGLYVGRVIDEYRETFGPGDFLIRNVLGTNDATGAIAITDRLRVGQTVQFQVRDKNTAEEDLQLCLEGQSERPVAGALLFSCNGRGEQMFGRPGHDVGVAAEKMPATPVAGFFAAGEFGPIGRRNFVHGQTASFALFRPRTEDKKDGNS